ncbi:DUF4832 domain-containing protein [Photobacterium damselae]|nr:DUF4832 domain-containing protein [Photobacterium damselae]
MKKTNLYYAALISSLIISQNAYSKQKQETINYYPETINDILVNPDIGITDFHTFDRRNDPWWSEPTHPETSVVYFRWYWEELETEEGKYNFQLIDDTINQAKNLGKKFVFRFMTMSGLNETYYNPSPLAGKKTLGIPCWLKKQIDPNTFDICKDDNSYVVDYKNPLLKEKLTKFVNAMGQRYNSNKNILRIDVGLVGTWGEWNLATHADHAELGQNGYTYEDLRPYVDMMHNAFPDQQLSIDLGSRSETIASDVTSRLNLGWRADCLGDWAPWGWNHMENGYPDTINFIEGNSTLANRHAYQNFSQHWKTAPVDFEVCTSLNDFSYEPNIYTRDKIKQTFDFALNKHASLLNIKSGNVPEMYQDLMDDFLKKLGYRFELSFVQLISNFKPGSNITINSTWKNVGSAPSYNNYPVSWRLINQKNNSIITWNTENDITKWYPAEDINQDAHNYNQNNIFSLPVNMQTGMYKLQVALLDNNNNPTIKLGISGRDNDGWHTIGDVYIK